MRNFRIKPSNRRTSAFYLSLLAAFLFAGCATQAPSSKTGTVGSGMSASTEITSIKMIQASDAINVQIIGNAPLAYTSVKQANPLGVVLYFPSTRLRAAAETQVPSETLIAAIQAGQVETKTDATRIAILLTKDVDYNVVQGDNAITVQFPIMKTAKVSTTPAVHQEAHAATPPAATENVQPMKPQPMMAKTEQPSGIFQGTGSRIEGEKKIWVNRIDFLGESDGRSTLSIETTAKVDYRISKISDKLLELRLDKANIAEFRQRPLITTRFESAVNRIMPVQLPSMHDYAMFSVELREPVPYYVEQVGELLLVHFEASTIPPAPADAANLPAWKKALEEIVTPVDMHGPSVGAPSIAASSPTAVTDNVSTGNVATGSESGDAANPVMPDVVMDADQALVVTKKVKSYTGEKIALDFYQTDIKNVFRILREVSGKNFAIDKDVNGKVTLTLDKPVPWDQVMDLVLRMNQLGMIVEGDIIRIATLETLRQENELRKAQIAALQKEKEQIKALEPLETRYIPVSYSDATNEVLPHIENIITKDRGTVSVDAKNNQIIITDTANKIEQANEIVNKIDKVTSQVIIEARVVEVNETYTKELGFQWNFGVGPVTLNNHGSEYDAAIAMNYPANTNNGLGLSYSKIAGTPFTLDAALTALETNGNGKILSAPKIVTLNNKKAKIKQGREIGYLERDSAGGSSVVFKDVDLLLEVTPHVTPDNRISLYILIRKNDVEDYVEGVPVIATNEAETQLLVNDGDTIVIGGIIKANSTKEKTAFPGLHKIPVVGWMFQSNLEDRVNKELLIFLNPKIVQLEQRNVVN